MRQLRVSEEEAGEEGGGLHLFIFTRVLRNLRASPVLSGHDESEAISLLGVIEEIGVGEILGFPAEEEGPIYAQGARCGVVDFLVGDDEFYLVRQTLQGPFVRTIDEICF